MTVAMVEKRQRKARSDAGQVRQTARDALVLHWLCQMYGAPLDLIQEALQIGRPRAYQLADRWKRAGWIDKAVVDPGPVWLYPRKHVVEQYLEWSPAAWVPKVTTSAHVRAVAAVRLHETRLNGLAGPGDAMELEHWISERQLAHEQGYAKKGQPQQHTPDGVLILPSGERVLIEVELTAKSIERYQQKLADIRIRADQLQCAHVAYYCKPGEVHRVVSGQVAERRKERERKVFEQSRGIGDGGLPGPMWHVKSLEEVKGWQLELPRPDRPEGR